MVSLDKIKMMLRDITDIGEHVEKYKNNPMPYLMAIIVICVVFGVSMAFADQELVDKIDRFERECGVDFGPGLPHREHCARLYVSICPILDFSPTPELCKRDIDPADYCLYLDFGPVPDYCKRD